MSTEGAKEEMCCICGGYALSVDLVSSVRFERFFQACFNLTKSRSGFMCPICVTTVRKWRKNPKDRRKSMSMMVDSRKGSKKLVTETSQSTDTVEKNTDEKVERKRHRSLIGCCVCGAKSSASEFVTSDKLGRLLRECFQLTSKREGELCHSCREILRKWRRQPRGAKQNYNYIVDSKVVPKRKHSSSSSRSKSDDQKEAGTPKGKVDIKSVGQIFTYDDPLDDTLSEEDNVEDEEDIISGEGLNTPSPSPSPASSVANGSEYGDPFDPPRKKMVSTASQTAFLFPMLTSPQGVNSRLPFIDLSTWRQESICCGSIFRGPNGEVLVDPKWLKPFCDFCNRSDQLPTPIEKNNPTEISVFDDKLSDLCGTKL